MLSRTLYFTALSFLFQTPFPGGHAWLRLHPALRFFRSLSNQVDQAVQGILTISFLGTEALGVDHDDPFIGHSPAGQPGQTITKRFRQMGGAVKAELDRR